jgi:hypothetical protein
MLAITLVAATLVVASGAWPSENFQPTDASLQGTQEMENDAMDAGYPEYFRENELEESDVMFYENPANIEGFLDAIVTVPKLKIGQSIEVVYTNPKTGALSVNLVTATNDVALHFNPRFSTSGGYVVLNTLRRSRGGWQKELHPSGYPFPANNVRTRVTVRITVQASGFLISVNGINISLFAYRPGLRYDTVRKITWVAPADAVLESVKLTF